jgi:HEAT repeat protein
MQPGQTQREVASVEAILGQMRGTNAVACEMAMVAVDHNNWFGDWGDNGNSPLLDNAQRPQLPGTLESDGVIAPLMTALKDSDLCVRRTAASLLGRARNPRVTERLRSALEDGQPETRALAAFALGSAEEQSAGPKLQQLLRDADPAVRATAAWSLGQLEYRPALDALTELLARDQSARVRRAAARALGQIAS